VNFTCMKIQFSERLKSRRTRLNQCTSQHINFVCPPHSNAHAYRLLIFKELVAPAFAVSNKEAEF